MGDLTVDRSLYRRGRRRLARMGRSPLSYILVVQFLLSLRLHNSAFQDEALYIYGGSQIIGHVLHHRQMFENFDTYFSGTPEFIPVILGALNSVGGLALARLFSTIWMLIATICCYSVGGRLFGRRSGTFAAALFGSSASVLFVARMATYDASSLGFLSVATFMSVRAAERRRGGSAFLVGVLLVMAVLAKYAAGLFVPSVLGLLVLQSVHRGGWKRAVSRGALAAVGCTVGVGIVYLALGSSLLHGIESTTTARKTVVLTPAMTILTEAGRLGGLVLALSLAGLAIVVRRHRPSRALVALLLFVTGLLPPAYHAYTGENVSLSKHIAFGLFFAAPLAGVVVARMAGRSWNRLDLQRAFPALAVCLIVLGIGVTQSSQLHNGWPDSTPMVAVLRSQIRPDNSRILVEEPEVPRYYLQHLVAPWEWTGLTWFQYKQNGVLLQGAPAFRAAIAVGYFDLVVLQYGYNAVLAHSIDGGLLHGSLYQLLAKVPYNDSFGRGFYWIWRRR